MKQEKKYTVKKNVANAFGSLGYIFSFLQWLWAATLYLNLIHSSTSFIFPKSSVQVEQPSMPTFTLPEPLGMIIIGTIVVVMVIITIYAFIVMPKGIVKASNKAIHKAAGTMTPLVIKAQHKQDSKKNRIKITLRLVLALKLLLVLTPLILTVASKYLEEQPLDYSIVMVVGYTLACFSVTFFTIQYPLAKILRVRLSELW